MSCVSGPTAPLDSHVVYIMIAGQTLLTSPSAPLAGIDRQADNEKEGGYITAFLTNDWHKVSENYRSLLHKFTDVLLF